MSAPNLQSSADATQESNGFVIVNPENNLVWSARDKRCVSLRGDFSTYSSAAKAEAAIRRTNLLKHRGMLVARIAFTHGMAYVKPEEDQRQRAWETAMGMRGYAGSPAEAEDRKAKSSQPPEPAPKLQEVLDNIVESGLLSEEQYDVLVAALNRPFSAISEVSK